MVQVDEKDLVYKGPWVRSAQQKVVPNTWNRLCFSEGYLSISGESDLGFSQWGFQWEALHEGQITFHAASASEPPGKRLSQIKSVPVHLTVHDRNDMDILTKEGTSGLRKHKFFAWPARLLIKMVFWLKRILQSCFADLRRTIRRDIKELKQQGIDVLLVAWFKILVPEWLINLKLQECGLKVTGSTLTSNAKQVILAFQSRDISQDFLNRSDSTSEATHYQKYANWPTCLRGSLRIIWISMRRAKVVLNPNQ